MSAKNTRIELKTKNGGSGMFGIEHATAILADKWNNKETGWYIPEDSEYEYRDGIITKKRRNVENRRYKRQTTF